MSYSGAHEMTGWLSCNASLKHTDIVITAKTVDIFRSLDGVPGLVFRYVQMHFQFNNQNDSKVGKSTHGQYHPPQISAVCVVLLFLKEKFLILYKAMKVLF